MKNDEPRYGLTQEECKRLVDRHIDVMKQRKLEEDYDLLQAIKTSQILARAKDL